MPTYINLLEYHRPLMQAGDYLVSIDQKLVIPSKGINETYRQDQGFAVLGDRFILSPERVFSMFPPHGSRGDCSTTLPHIVLNRSTLPWERSAGDRDSDTGNDPTWLALLVFWGDEAPQPKNITVSELKSTASDHHMPTPANLSGDIDSEMIAVIDVQKELLETVMPKVADLYFLAHSKREALANDGSAPSGPERAVIMANRLPMRNGTTTVHLVSLENRFEGSADEEFNYLTASNPDDLIRLVSLKSWSFSCVDPKFNFTGLLKHLNRTPSTLQKPYLNDEVVKMTIAGTTLTDASNNGFVKLREETFATIVDDPELLSFSNFQYFEIEKEFDQDKDEFPDLDPFPDHQAFTVAVNYTRQNNGSTIPIIGKEPTPPHGTTGKPNVEKYRKPGLWEVADGGLTYELYSSEGVRHEGTIDGFFTDDNEVSIIWTKDDLHFCFYKNGQLVAQTPAPGSVYSKDSTYWLTQAGLSSFTTFRRAITENEARHLAEGSSPNSHLVTQLGNGFTAFPHHLRKSDRTASWYRGPLSPAPTDSEMEGLFQFPAVAADELVIYDKNTGMFDVTYASAWELGRMMALKDQQFAINLYNWKRKTSQSNKPAEDNVAHLPFVSRDDTDSISEIQTEIEKWLNNRQFLDQIPFHYLVPEESFLPKESIRFVWVDPTWINCLKDGAFSLGRATNADFEEDKTNSDPTNGDIKNLQGFFFRSEIAAGFPGMNLNVYDVPVNYDPTTALDSPTLNTLTPLTPVAGFPRKYADDIVLYIYELEAGKNIETIDFFLDPKELNFGMDTDGSVYSKSLKQSDGDDKFKPAPDDDEIDSYQLVTTDWHDEDHLVLNIANFADSLYTEAEFASGANPDAKNTSADFALLMLEGVDKVRFRRS